MIHDLITALAIAVGIIGGLLFLWVVIDFICKDRRASSGSKIDEITW